MSRRSSRLSFVATGPGQALTSGGPAPTDPETGLRYPILKVWGLPDQNVAVGLSEDVTRAVPAGWEGVGGKVRARVDDAGGAKDRRIIAVGIQPVYLNLGQYDDVKVNVLQLTNSNSPICSQWLRAVPAGVFMSRLRAPTLTSTGTPSSELYLPDGAARIRASISVVLTFQDFASGSLAGGVLTTKSYSYAVAADEWLDIPAGAGSVIVSDPADLFIELDPL